MLKQDGLILACAREAIADSPADYILDTFTLKQDSSEGVTLPHMFTWLKINKKMAMLAHLP